MKWVCALLFCLAAVSMLLADAWDQTPWHPFGVDEYGRDSLRALIAATASSVLYAALLLAIALLLPTLVAWLAQVRKIAGAAWLLRASSQVIESIPAIMLVLAAIAAFPAGGFYLIALVFAFVVLPSVGNLLAGEFARLMQTGFVQVALMQQIPEHKLLIRYFLPNATSVLRPLMLQLFGSAMTVIGAVGVLGMSNRQTLDLGVFLLRGKEQLATRPSLMLMTLLAFLLVFLLLWRLLQKGADPKQKLWRINQVSEAVERLLAGEIGVVNSPIGLLLVTAKAGNCELIAIEKGWDKSPVEHRKALGLILPSDAELRTTSDPSNTVLNQLHDLRVPLCVGRKMTQSDGLDDSWRAWVFPQDRVWQLMNFGPVVEWIAVELRSAGAILLATSANFSQQPNLRGDVHANSCPSSLSELDPAFAQLADFYLESELIVKEPISIVDLTQQPAVLVQRGRYAELIAEVLLAQA